MREIEAIWMKLAAEEADGRAAKTGISCTNRAHPATIDGCRACAAGPGSDSVASVIATAPGYFE